MSCLLPYCGKVGLSISERGDAFEYRGLMSEATYVSKNAPGKEWSFTGPTVTWLDSTRTGNTSGLAFVPKDQNGPVVAALARLALVEENV
jgi:hypothetical protein